MTVVEAEGYKHDSEEREPLLAQTEISLLLAIKAVAEAPDFDTALAAALRLICQHTNCLLGEVWLRSPGKDALEISPIHYQRDLDNEIIKRFRLASGTFTYAQGMGLAGRIWSSKEPEWLHDISSLSKEDDPRLAQALAAGLKAALGIPIVADSEVLAVLIFAKVEPWKKDERLVELVSAVAAQLGSLLRRKQVEEQLRQAYEALGMQVEKQSAVLTYMNATLIEQFDAREQAEAEIRQRNQELAALNRISAAVSSSLELPKILEALKNLFVEQLILPAGVILFYDKASDTLELKASWGFADDALSEVARFAVAGSHFEPVIRKQETFHSADFCEGDLLALEFDKGEFEWQSHLCVPLLTKGTVQGILGIFSRTPTAFGEAQATFFQTVGQQVGVAIQNAQLFEQVLAGRERLRQLTQQVVSAQEAERHRVSRELHDEAGQALTVLKFTLQMMLTDLPVEGVNVVNPGLLRPHLLEAIALCETTMEGIRLLAHDLRPAALDDLGLNLTLEGFCHDFAEHTNLTIEYGGVESLVLPEPVEITLYRFLQEALTNVAKHAHAYRVWVTLSYENGVVSLMVQDDGKGFDAQVVKRESTQAKGMGLPGMRERLELLGGWLETYSKSGQGTGLVARVPAWEVD